MLPVLAVAALAALGVFASRYQPLSDGGLSGPALPGLPAGAGLRVLHGPGGTYIPPQRGVISLTESIRNIGTHAVTIVSVGFDGPQPQLAGKVLNVTAYVTQFHGQPRTNFKPEPVDFSTRGPGQFMALEIPLRVPVCAGDQRAGALVSTDVFVVKERFLGFTHLVRIPLYALGSSAGIAWRAPTQAGSATACSG